MTGRLTPMPLPQQATWSTGVLVGEHGPWAVAALTLWQTGDRLRLVEVASLRGLLGVDFDDVLDLAELLAVDPPRDVFTGHDGRTYLEALGFAQLLGELDQGAELHGFLTDDQRATVRAVRRALRALVRKGATVITNNVVVIDMNEPHRTVGQVWDTGIASGPRGVWRWARAVDDRNGGSRDFVYADDLEAIAGVDRLEATLLTHRVCDAMVARAVRDWSGHRAATVGAVTAQWFQPIGLYALGRDGALLIHISTLIDWLAMIAGAVADLEADGLAVPDGAAALAGLATTMADELAELGLYRHGTPPDWERERHCLDVACSRCGAGVNRRCQTARGGTAGKPHAGRRRAAEEHRRAGGAS